MRQSPKKKMLLALLITAAMAACGETGTLPVEAGMGADPVLAEPNTSLIPTVSVAPAVGWAEAEGNGPQAGFEPASNRI